MNDILYREFVYLWYYFTLQLEQIFHYWLLGILIGSAVSVFCKDVIHNRFLLISSKKYGFLGLMVSSILGILSPLCMYGTIPIAASFSKKGVKDDLLAAFIVSSIMLNPQLFIYSLSLGREIAMIRLVSSSICGITAGVCLGFFYKEKNFLTFQKCRNYVEKIRM